MSDYDNPGVIPVLDTGCLKPADSVLCGIFFEFIMNMKKIIISVYILILSFGFLACITNENTLDNSNVKQDTLSRPTIPSSDKISIDFSMEEYQRLEKKEVADIFPALPQELPLLEYKITSNQLENTPYKHIYAVSKSNYTFNEKNQNFIDTYIYNKETKEFVCCIKDSYEYGVWNSNWSINNYPVELITIINKSNTVFLAEKKSYEVCRFVDGTLWACVPDVQVKLSDKNVNAGQKITISTQNTYCKYIMVCGCYNDSKWGYDGLIKLIEGAAEREETIIIPYVYDKMKICISNDGQSYMSVLLEKKINKPKEKGRVFKIPASYEIANLYRKSQPDPRVQIILNNKDLDTLRQLDPDAYLTEIVKILNSMDLDQFEKVTFIHDFIASLLCYDYDGVYVHFTEVPDDYPSVLRRRKAKCAGYANLFHEICNRADIVCEIVGGYARGLGWSPEDNVKERNHSWNMVLINGEWYLVDCTWDSGRESNDIRDVKCEHTWLFAKPTEFINTHLPTKDEFQLIAKPVSPEAFKKLKYANPSFVY